MAGPLHAKGVLILSSFLAARFSRVRAHSIVASLVFEQTYGMVEGDSASMAELVALMSSIGGLPLRQNLAITGSVDQLGNAVQRPGDIGVEGRGGFEEIGNGGKEAHGVLVQMARPALAPFGRLMAVEIQSPMAASLARSMPVSMPNPSSR